MAVPSTADLFRLETAQGLAAQELETAAAWRTAQVCTHLMASGALRDGWTGRAMPQRLSTALAIVSGLIEHPQPGWLDDSLTRIVDHCAVPLAAIARVPRQRFRRERAVVPLWRARQLDDASVRWLTRQTGKTIDEKLGRQRRVLAVVRRPDENVPENRATVQLADALARAIKWRLFTRPAQPAAPQDGRSDRVLRDALRACEAAVDGLALGKAAERLVTRPNNALLADPNYRRIWQARTWLAAHRKDIMRALDELPERLAICQLWVLATCLMDCIGVTMEDALVVREAGFGAEPFGISPIAGASATNVTFWIERPSGRALLRLSAKQNRILLEERRLRGQGELLSVAGPNRRWLTLTTETPKGGFVTCAAEMPDGHGGTARIARAGMDGRGQRAIANLIARERRALNLLNPAPPVGAPEASDYSFIGLDWCAVAPRIHADGKKVATPERLTLARIGGAHLAICRADHPFRLDGEPWHSAPALLEALRQRSASGEARAAENLAPMFDALWRGIIPSHSDRPRQLAIAVSGLLPEPAQRRLREAAGRPFSEVWLIDRSIAAALGWQGSWQNTIAAPAVTVGEMLLVVDAEFGGLRIVPLQAASDQRLEGSPHYGIYWQRDLRLPKLAPATGVTALAWIEIYLETALQRLAAQIDVIDLKEQVGALAHHLIAQGEAERLFNGDGAIRVGLPLGADVPTHAIWLTRDEVIARQATERWCGRYEDWLRANADKVAEHLSRWRPENGAVPYRWKILYAGRPFHLDAMRNRVAFLWNSTVGTRCGNQHGFVHEAPREAEWLVARGCEAFLQRQYASSGRVETWKDSLSALYLDIESDTGFHKSRILPGIDVAPGETVTHRLLHRDGQGFVLPRGESHYLLPVLEGETAEPAGMSAIVEPPGFPLPHNLPVDLEVDYTYARADYELRLRPALKEDGTRWDAPFSTVIARWIAEYNIAPQFAPVDIASELTRLAGQIAFWMDRNPTFAGLQPHQVGRLRDSVDEIADDAAFREIAAELWMPCIDRLFNVQPAPQGNNAERRLAELLATGIGLLRLPLSDELIKSLGDALRAPPGQEHQRYVRLRQNRAARLLGRLLRNAERLEQVPLLARLVEITGRRRRNRRVERPPAGQLPDFASLNPLTGALGLILVNEPAFASRLQVDHSQPDGLLELLDSAEAILTKVKEVLQASDETLDRDWLDKVCFVLFRNVGEILAGLLHLRAVADSSAPESETSGARALALERLALVEAGKGRTHKLARLIYEVDAMLYRLRANPPKERLAVERSHADAHKNMYPLAFLLYRLLAGHDPHRLVQRKIEETVEDEDA